jgi:hypothetical protein
MNTLLQNTLVFIAVTLAVAFLVKKFLWKSPKQKKACGKDGCGCH